MARDYEPAAFALIGDALGYARDWDEDEYLAEVLLLADPEFDIIAFDPQTSGGLLAAVAPESVDELRGVFTVIGEVVKGEPGLQIV